MEIKTKFELRTLLVPELRQSLKILTLALPDLKELVESELENNPFIEESHEPPLPSTASSGIGAPESHTDFTQTLIAQKPTLQDVLLRQLGMFTSSNEDFAIGQEIIGNIDDNGYLTAGVDEIAQALQQDQTKVETVLKLIQKFEPLGVAARSLSECLRIQLDSLDENDRVLRQIVESHLDDLAKKHYSRIAKALKVPLEEIEAAIKHIHKLNPKPGRDYCAESVHHIVPDIVIEEKDEDLVVSVNNEDIPALSINRDYKAMLRSSKLSSGEKEFLMQKLSNALELIRAVSRRNRTLKKVIEVIVEIQEEGIRNGASFLKPLTFKAVAERLQMHETTICRVVMNKYIQTPCGICCLKDFFSSHIEDENGQDVSSHEIKALIKEMIDAEDQKHPLSDVQIARMIAEEKNLKVARRTITKYRESMRILPTYLRRQR